jgi:phosphoribosylanthranilate isomerase
MVKVKICGITHEEDATWAASLGADYIGLNFYKESPRHISPKAAKAIVSKVPPFVIPVGVFVNHTPEEIASYITEVGLQGVQLHGDETPEQIETLRKLMNSGGNKVSIIKTLRIGNEQDMNDLDSHLRGNDGFANLCDYFLLDSRDDNQPGGTGKQFPWTLAQEFKKRHDKPMFLAGGLTPENVKMAIKEVQPYAVDVASGVEKTPRRKDYEKLKTFITEAKKSR